MSVEPLNSGHVVQRSHRTKSLVGDIRKNVHYPLPTSVRAAIFNLLGKLCELYPEVMTCHYERLIDIYMRTLQSEMVTKAKKKLEMPVIAGVLRGLRSYLVNFSQSAEEGWAERILLV